MRPTLAAANGLEPDQVRVITPDVGGGFGAKIGVYGEEQVLGRLAKETGRPVRWRETRSESMMALGHGRAQLQYITIGGKRDGTVTHYQLHALQDSGGFADMGTILAPFMTRPMSSGVYAIPNIEVRPTSVVTNTTPTVAYRGAGRPEATAAIERAMDLFAAEIGMDPAEVRRKNLIPKFSEPHTTAIGQTYDVGDYETALDKALAAADYKALRAEQAKRRANKDAKQIGIGVSVYVEITGGAPQLHENARIEVQENGRAVVYTGTSPHGQGHITAWSMIASEETGIPMSDIDVVWGDTDLIPEGGGTMGSRSLQQGGAAVSKASIELVEKAKGIAARLLEAAESDIELDKGRGAFHVAGTPSVAKTWAEIA
ncbi:MAG: xanthine dehydrogenase family protein molybdopterin-binding subunit, partial [Actinomycetota bacterium]